MPWPVAIMLGAILIVSGPTVINPILDFARPAGRVRGILVWEGTLLDPLGALVAVVIFQIVKASDATTIADGVAIFIGGIGVAIVAAAIGTALFVIGGRLVRGNAMFATQVVLASVLVTAGLANLVSDDSGLLAALLMGIAAPRIAKRVSATTTQESPFFDTIVSIGIGVLFVSISALVPLDTVEQILVPTLVVAILLILVQRPLVSMLCSVGSGLTRKERIFIAAMDPRGIVAAATASSVGAVLVASNVPGRAGPAARGVYHHRRHRDVLRAHRYPGGKGARTSRALGRVSSAHHAHCVPAARSDRGRDGRQPRGDARRSA
jgi:NhaP-type Na+/H+ or K+/H+ antiporter